MFRHVETSLLGALAEAFDCRKQNIDYFYDDGREVQAPETKTLLVTSDRTNTIPMSEGRGVGGERYLACCLFFVRAKNDEVYCFSTNEMGLALTDSALDRLVYRAARLLEDEGKRGQGVERSNDLKPGDTALSRIASLREKLGLPARMARSLFAKQDAAASGHASERKTVSSSESLKKTVLLVGNRFQGKVRGLNPPRFAIVTLRVCEGKPNAGVRWAVSDRNFSKRFRAVIEETANAALKGLSQFQLSGPSLEVIEAHHHETDSHEDDFEAATEAAVKQVVDRPSKVESIQEDETESRTGMEGTPTSRVCGIYGHTPEPVAILCRPNWNRRKAFRR